MVNAPLERFDSLAHALKAMAFGMLAHPTAHADAIVGKHEHCLQRGRCQLNADMCGMGMTHGIVADSRASENNAISTNAGTCALS